MVKPVMGMNGQVSPYPYVYILMVQVGACCVAVLLKPAMGKVAFEFNVALCKRHRYVIAGNRHPGYGPGIAGIKQGAAGKGIVLVAEG
jgi:hypothetical protein